jgi:two-component system nitrogen regulation sensor histidine kinase NtrY
MSTAETIPSHSSFMKEARAHYRMRGGKALAILTGLLFLALLFLIVQARMKLIPTMTPHLTMLSALLILALMLVVVSYAVFRRATLLWKRAHDGVLGTRLQSRIIVMFSAIAILPTLVVASFSILFFNIGIKSWFDTQVVTALENSVSISRAYIDEHKGAIRNEALSLGQALHNDIPLALSNPEAFAMLLNRHGQEHRLSEVIVMDRSVVIARNSLSFSLMFERLPEAVISRADSGDVAIFGDDRDKIQAVIKISSHPDLYLMIVRMVDPTVLNHMQTALQTVNEYHTLDKQLSQLQEQFLIVFILMALLVLLASLWAGMLLAMRLIEPLRALMSATDRVRGGDYTIRVPEGRADDEIGNLGRTFNRMTGQLETQRHDLMEATRTIDERRRFTEAVLSGVSAGILALNNARHVTLTNRSAPELLGRDGSIVGLSVTELLPEIPPLIEAVNAKPDKLASADMVILNGTTRRTLHVQVTAEKLGDAIEGYIVTFDDITALVSAQRSAAWADVARRIAHEIKNPLTPITLSAERIRKKFAPSEGSEERESFDKYLDTISRHVRDIGRMVEEFVTYARLPQSVFAEENLVAIVKKAAFSAQTTHPEIRYTQQLPGNAVLMMCDEAQLGQTLLNLLKNAAEALEAAEKKEITITLDVSETTITLRVDDTGVGFPADKITTLTEPYVTTRAKGTGLGLAIVKRTVEEHKGTLTLTNREGGGACVTMVFPR